MKVSRYDGRRNTSLEIVQRGYRDAYPYGSDGRRFFKELREAILTEYEEQGYCPLINRYLHARSTTSKMDVIEAAVFADVREWYSKGRMTDIERNPDYAYVPYIELYGRPVMWKECRFYGSLSSRVDEDYLNSLLEAIDRMGRASHQNNADPGKPQQNVKTDEESDANAFSQANDAAENAQRRYDELIQEGEQRLREARDEADRIINEAKRQAEEIRQAANRDAENQAQQDASSLVRRYIADAQTRYKHELDAEMNRMTQKSMESTQRRVDETKVIIDETNRIQREWVAALQQTVDQINAAKSDLYAQMKKWQLSLYFQNIMPLAQNYVELYRVINVDRLLREEIVPKDESYGPEPSEQVINGLNRLNSSLNTVLRKYESSLKNLDLYVYYPAAGEMFDDEAHVPNEDYDMDLTGKRISGYILPGVKKKANDDMGDEVIIKAEVTIDMEN